MESVAKRPHTEVEMSPPAQSPPLTLSAIGVLLDQKLAPFSEKLSSMQTELSSVKVTVADAIAKSESASEAVTVLKTEVLELKSEVKRLKEYITAQDTYSRRETLNFYGIAENPGEDCRDLLWELFETMDIQYARAILFSRIHRLGAKSDNNPRPIRVRFHYYPDLERVYAQRKMLQGSPYRISKVFAPEIEKNRAVMFPYVNAAFRYRDSLPTADKHKLNVKFKDDTLILNGTKYNVDNIKTLPSYLTPQASSTKETDSHIFFWTKHSPLSNHYPAHVVVDNVHFKSAEHLIMHRKALLFKDTQTASKILKSKDAAEAKSLGKEVKGFDKTVWNRHSLDIVKSAVLAKFNQHDDLRSALLATGSKVLVEANPYDKFWGVGLRLSDPKILDPGQWQGKNNLGELLQKVRSHFVDTSSLKSLLL